MKIVSKKFFLPALFASLVVSQQALAANAEEQEANHPIAMGQFITPGMMEYEVAAAIGNATGASVDDVDFYKFYGQQGDVVTVDIDGGIGGVRSVDTVLAVFGDGPNYKRWRTNDDARTLDPGSTSRMDARIDNFALPETGVYYIGVVNYGKSFATGGMVNGTRVSNGDYTLVVSGVSSAVLHINIDVKPGVENISPLNPKARGNVPVALLSADNFNPADVDVNSLTFGHDGDEHSLEKCNKGSADFNKDGVKELICHFDNPTAGFHKGDEEGVLKGKLKDGTLIEGHGLLKVVPEKGD